ncbi:tubulin epsilon and delta complex protein 1 isoform X2 [Anoplopoma fimbria]|uniref:tubulin epsilon and delta complex protein 1 isoform X2 n=1 Tax=Anoplopoma fimbria TaxID=229290 RepID=UPI0023ED4733|nr:tubulin epsilon and delta complex protein 1 isoform X2 [Anoplopoma fimbria]
MQRSKAAVSVEVRRVVAALCRLVAATGLQSVPTPESFRRAKFGGGPEEDQLWQLLSDVLQTSLLVSSGASVQPGGAAENRKLVVAGLWQTGYHAGWMYGSWGGGAGGEGVRPSSRDLLLALGWLLAAGKLEELLTLRVQQLDKTLLAPTPVNPQLTNRLPSDSASLKRLHWLIGCLRYQGRTLLSMQEERTRLLHAVFFASISSSVSSSSSDQSSAVLTEDCVCMQQLCDLLEAYLNWKQVEKVFWTWMDSVLDGHLTDPVIKKPTHDAPYGNARVCHHGNRGLEKLEDMLLRLPTGQKGQRRARRDGEDRGEGGERSQCGSDTSRLPPLVSSFSCLPSLPQVYRARLQTERPVRHSRRPAEGTHRGAETPDELQASQAAQLLLQTEALLLERRDRQRLANRTQLQEMIGSLDELVLIPPQTFLNPRTADLFIQK